MEIWQGILVLLGAVAVGAGTSLGTVALINRHKTGNASIVAKTKKVDDETARKVKFYDEVVGNEEKAKAMSICFNQQKGIFLNMIAAEEVAVDIQDGKVVDSETTKSVGELFELAKGDLKLENAVMTKLLKSGIDDLEKTNAAALVAFNSLMSYNFGHCNDPDALTKLKSYLDDKN